MGQVCVLECAFWGFPLLFALLHLFPRLHLFVTLPCTQPSPRCACQLSVSYQNSHRPPCLQASESSLHFRNCSNLQPARRQQERKLQGAYCIPRGVRNLPVRAKNQQRGPELCVLVDSRGCTLDSKALEGGVGVSGDADCDAGEALGEPALLLVAHSEAKEQPVEMRRVSSIEWGHVEPSTPAQHTGHLSKRIHTLSRFCSMRECFTGLFYTTVRKRTQGMTKFECNNTTNAAPHVYRVVA